MKKGMFVLILALGIGLAATSWAGQVNIAYPIDGGSYPITDPAPGKLNSAYFTSSFSVTCGGGGHKVEWGYDRGAPLGSASFYDYFSAQFVHKLPGGGHVFWVRSDCGKGMVKFNLGK